MAINFVVISSLISQYIYECSLYLLILCKIKEFGTRLTRIKPSFTATYP